MAKKGIPQGEASKDSTVNSISEQDKITDPTAPPDNDSDTEQNSKNVLIETTVKDGASKQETEDTTNSSDSPERVKSIEKKHIMKNEKPSQLDLVRAFRDIVKIVRIQGKLYYYHSSKRCYQLITNKTKMKEIFYQFMKQYYKDPSIITSSITNSCSDLLMLEYYPEVIASDSDGFLPFCDCTVNINRIIDYNTRHEEINTKRPLSEHYIFPYTLTIPYSSPSYSYYNTPWMDYYIHRITRDNQEIADRIWQMIGYILAPDYSGKCFFLLQGESNTGKSVLGNLLSSFFHPENVTSLSFSRLGDKKSSSALINSRLNIAMDISRDKLKPKAIENLKLYTGGDIATVEYSNGKLEQFYCRSKFVFSSNSELIMDGYDDAFYKRIVCIPFKQIIKNEEQDTTLINKLRQELPAIGNKALFMYYIPLRNNGYVFSGGKYCIPQIAHHNTTRIDGDISIQKFVEDCCSFNENATCFTRDLYGAYCDYCKSQHLDPIDDIRNFSRRLNIIYRDADIGKRKINTGNENLNAFKGIEIKNSSNVVANSPDTQQPNGYNNYSPGYGQYPMNIGYGYNPQKYAAKMFPDTGLSNQPKSSESKEDTYVVTKVMKV